MMNLDSIPTIDIILKDTEGKINTRSMLVEDVDNISPQSFLDVGEVIADLIKHRLSQSDQQTIREMKKKDLITLHFSLGMWIRNNYGLWIKQNPLVASAEDSSFVDENGVDCNPQHPDAVSNRIIEDLHTKLNNSQAYAFDYAMEGINNQR